MQRAIPTKPALLHKPVACNAQFRTAHATGWNVEDAARCNAMHTKPKEPTHSGRPSRHARLTKRTQIARLCIRHLPEDRRPICVYPRSSSALWFFGNERTPCRPRNRLQRYATRCSMLRILWRPAQERCSMQRNPTPKRRNAAPRPRARSQARVPQHPPRPEPLGAPPRAC
jgi:hypothetical protein